MSLVGQRWDGGISVLLSQRSQHRYAHFWQRRPSTTTLCRYPVTATTVYQHPATTAPCHRPTTTATALCHTTTTELCHPITTATTPCCAAATTTPSRVFSTTGTHQIAEANQEKNDKLRMAFGISEYFVDGSSLDPQRQAKETEAKALAMAQKQYE